VFDRFAQANSVLPLDKLHAWFICANDIESPALHFQAERQLICLARHLAFSSVPIYRLSATRLIQPT
jgi:hypothetical protein